MPTFDVLRLRPQQEEHIDSFHTRYIGDYEIRCDTTTKPPIWTVHPTNPQLLSYSLLACLIWVQNNPKC